MEEKASMPGRIGWIDIAKVLGLVIVLINHAGLDLGPVNFFGGMFYVPIFFVLAGYTYRYRPEESFSVFVKKAKRLLVPYVGYNLFLFLFFFGKNALAAGGITKEAFAPLFGILYSRSYLYAGVTEGQQVLMTTLNGPTWFLTGLFVTLLGFELLLRFTKGEQKLLQSGMALCLLAAWGLDFLPVLLPWSLDTMFGHMVLMGFGYLLGEENGVERMYRKPGCILLLAVLFVLASTGNGSGNLSIRDYGEIGVAAYLLAAAAGSWLAMLAAKWMELHLGKAAQMLAFIGSHTIGILCLHLFVFMLIQAGYAVVGIPASQSLWKVLMIGAAIVVLTPFYRIKRK